MSKGQRLEDRVTLAIVATVIIPALIGICLFAGPIIMKGCERETVGTTARDASTQSGATSAQAVTVTPSAKPIEMLSMCNEGNRCSPDSTGPWDGFCMSAKDPSVMLRCKGGRLVRVEGK